MCKSILMKKKLSLTFQKEIISYTPELIKELLSLKKNDNKFNLSWKPNRYKQRK